MKGVAVVAASTTWMLALMLAMIGGVDLIAVVMLVLLGFGLLRMLAVVLK